MANWSASGCEDNDLQFFQPMLEGFESKLSIPRAFLLHVEEDKSNKAILTTLIGTWVVGIKRETTQAVWFEAGWHEFVEAHDISPGDFIFFRYKGDMTFDVKIFDNTNCMKDYETFAQEDDVFTDPPTRPSVKVFIGPNHISFNEMPLPSKFRDAAGLADKHKISIQDEQGRLWPIKLCHRVDSRVFLGYGWLNFVNANNVQATDYCTFTAISNDILTTQISKNPRMQLNRSKVKQKGVMPAYKEKKRSCSLCRTIGHYVRTCPIVKVQGKASKNCHVQSCNSRRKEY